MEEEKTNMTYRGEEKTEMPNLEETKVNYSHDMQEEKEDRSTSSAAHAHFAGRVPAGSDLPICVSKNGVNHVRLLLGCLSYRHIIDSISFKSSKPLSLSP